MKSPIWRLSVPFFVLYYSNRETEGLASPTSKQPMLRGKRLPKLPKKRWVKTAYRLVKLPDEDVRIGIPNSVLCSLKPARRGGEYG